jgi:hypothetical protein
MEAKRFTFDDVENSFAGFYNPRERWNGWACPFFPVDECARILEWIGQYQDELEIGFRLSGDTLECAREIEDGVEWLPTPSRVVDGVEVFPLGAWCWVWDEIETPERPEFAVGFCKECREWQVATSDDGTGHCEHCHDFVRDCQCDSACLRCGDEFTVEV